MEGGCEERCSGGGRVWVEKGCRGERRKGFGWRKALVMESSVLVSS